ncbi:unnamed protein product [Bemisia tabaci]|uniref:Ribosomal protein S19 n=1 Tax=Bemisia tabaci TaxID=7038 RepID=A0A9P0EYL9_BEMTA|nr:PREDICTED: 40S ribosomal protein S19-like [Bemisia tabaci]CAH0384501.1 unnamed protein product [Bemisia tabaci]
MPSSLTLKDVDQQKFVTAFAAFLKKSGKLKVPAWVDVVKTGKHKELAPFDRDWYYTRCAAVLRHIYFRSPVGTKTVCKIFGGRKRNGVCPSHFCPSAGSVARKALQSLEDCKLIEKVEKGRRITPSGQRDVDRIAGKVRTEIKKKKFLHQQKTSGIKVAIPGTIDA